MLTTKMSFEDCEDLFNNIRTGNGNAKIPEKFIACLDEKKLKLVANKIDWIDFSLKFTNMFPEKSIQSILLATNLSFFSSRQAIN